MSPNVLSWLLGVIGAVIGGAVGYFVFGWIVDQGFYALLLPGALLGTGCGFLARTRSFPRGLLCGIGGLALGIYSEWSRFPFEADDSFTFFLAHLRDLRPVTLILIVLGGVLAFWLGRDRLTGRHDEQQPPSNP